MSRFDCQASSEWLQYFSFIREEAEDEDDRRAALELVAATIALCGDWISPLAVSLRVESCDPSSYYFEDAAHPPARPAWFLRRAEMDKRVVIGESWAGSVEKRVDVIDGAELATFTEEALSQPAPQAHLQVTLAELAIRATEIVLPDGVELALSYGGEPIEPVLIRDGQRLLAQGPDGGAIGPPARLRAYNHHGTTSLELELFWDFWQKHPAGRIQLRAAIDRVLGRQRGWKLEQGDGAAVGLSLRF